MFATELDLQTSPTSSLYSENFIMPLLTVVAAESLQRDKQGLPFARGVTKSDVSSVNKHHVRVTFEISEIVCVNYPVTGSKPDDSFLREAPGSPRLVLVYEEVYVRVCAWGGVQCFGEEARVWMGWDVSMRVCMCVCVCV